MRVVALGAGNPLLQDDGIGVRIAEELKDALAEKNVEVIIGETDVSYCLNCLRPDDYLVVLDAMYLGGVPGSVNLLPLQKAVSCRQKPFAIHDMNLVDAIAAEYPAIKGVLIGIEPAEFGIGLELSECLQNQFYRICEDVEMLLQKILEEMQDA